MSDITSAIVYATVTLLGIPHGRYKDISKLEKIGIVSSIALGIDAVIVPAFSGGKTLHQMVAESMGMSIPEAVESGVKMGEVVLAWAGFAYYAARNIYILHQI